ncbi:FAD/NAD(P)-binding domain-containing protein [Aspergillus coremiiformis]|uniref:FAD/NAD(P)-binding domain-containing protein n=1 Tax=Aspergillus coremiiformis TaxID=138285 RepID=A0A5N6ZC58_9EURO|nr:FAD/NAD(P)-binding domain-containing protein [Aspergillus coremiiformis]
MSDPEPSAVLCSSSPPTTQPSEPTAALNYAFLVHSQKTLTQNLPPRVDNKLLARQKRRRTSPEDHAILEAEYQRNPKPDKTARASIVSRVSLGEKEVQIWFQNRRQNDRRKSKPLQPHELLAPRSDVSKQGFSDESVPAEPGSSSGKEQADDSGNGSNAGTRPSESVSFGSDIVRGSQEESEQPILSSQTSVVTSEAPENSQGVQGNPSSELESNSQHESVAIDESHQNSAKRKRSVSDLREGRPEVHQPITPCGVQGMRFPPSLRISLSCDGEAMVRKEGELTPSPPKGRTALRIAMSSDGKAVIRADGEPSPSKNRISMFSTRSPRFTVLRRSNSAVILGTPRGSIERERIFGRSRDPRNWESVFDTDARSALSTPSSSQNASHTGSPGFFRSGGPRSLTRSLSAKYKNAATFNSSEHLNTPVPQATREKRRKLSRAVSSLGRLESGLGIANDMNSPYPAKGSKSIAGTADGDLELNCGDSDKENWIPGTRTTHVRRRAASQHHSSRPALRDAKGKEGKVNKDLSTRRSRLSQASQRKGNDKALPTVDAEVLGKSPSVAIIGAGLSGLRCADILIQNGARVTIFEARNRLGGRVHQSKVGDHLIDLGPNWIHGAGTNPMLAIAKLTKTTVKVFEGNQALISMDGTPLNDSITTKISEFVWTTIENAFRYSNVHKDTIPPERSLFEFYQEKLEKTDFTPEEKKLCIETCRLWGAYVGDPIERQSLKFFCLEECIDGDNYFVASTYKDTLEHVSRPALQHADVRFNQPIVKIDSNVHEDPNTRSEITLTTATGETHKFDEVVVTCPLGWLKRNKCAFTPELPPRFIQAIDSISYGRLEKVFVTFPRAFWHSDDPTSGDVRFSAYERPSFAQFLNPIYTAGPEGILWNQECLSLAALPAHCAHPTLLFYTYGPCATYIVSNVANLDPSSQEYYQFLDDFLRPFYSRLHGYSKSSPDCNPLAFVATRWQNDPYAGNGSYCNFQVGLRQGDWDIEILRAGLGPDRGVWFAGEHTAPFVALGTTTGAYWSGERAAGQICQLYGLGKLGMGIERDDSLPSDSGTKIAPSVD